MLLPEWTVARIEQEIDVWLADLSGRDESDIDIVRRLRLWPVYGDLGGELFINPHGEVYGLSHNSTELQIRPVSDPRWQTVARAAAVRLVPELSILLPQRPEGTPDCSACGGLGYFETTGGGYGCGVCWRLGWQQPVGSSE